MKLQIQNLVAFALIVLMYATQVFAVAPSRPTIRVDDPDGDGIQNCSPFDNVDDTTCWQNALSAAKDTVGFPYFGTVEATGTPDPAGVNIPRYYVSGTLLVSSAFGGAIEGNGAVIYWTGNNSGIPLFLLEDTQQLEIRNLSVNSSSAKPLQTAFEFTNASATSTVAPIANVIRHVYVDGINANGLQYGVRFSNRYGVDGNNDQSTIVDSTFYNVTTAAISIEHTQSMQHRFYSVNATGVPNDTSHCEADYPSGPNVCGSSFVRVAGGGFTSVGVFEGALRSQISI